MKTNMTKKTVYRNGNSFGTQYCNSCNGYATKWIVSINRENQSIVGLPRLIEINIVIDEKILEKIERSNRELDHKLGY